MVRGSSTTKRPPCSEPRDPETERTTRKRGSPAATPPAPCAQVGGARASKRLTIRAAFQMRVRRGFMSSDSIVVCAAWVRIGVMFRFQNKQLESLVDPAVHQDRLPGDVGGAVGGQPHDGVGDLLRPPQAAQGNVGGPALVDLLLADAGGQGARARQLVQPLGG